MAIRTINEQHLIDIANALRTRHGDTRFATITKSTVVSCTPGATGFDSLSSALGNSYRKTETITVPQAAYLEVKLGVPDNDYVDIIVTPGKEHNAETGTVYNTDWPDRKATYYEFRVDGDSATFYYGNSTMNPAIAGYYAEITGYDSDGNMLSTVEETVIVPNTYTTAQMADAIDSIEAPPPLEAYNVTGDCQYRFARGGWDWFIKIYGNKITTFDISELTYMFVSSNVENIPFEINCKNTSSGHNCNNMFQYCRNLLSVPKINNCKMTHSSYMFAGCNKLRELPEDLADWFNWSIIDKLTSAYSGGYRQNMFSECYSLRKAPPMEFLNHGNPYSTTSYCIYNSLFNTCTTLDEVVGLPLPHIYAAWTGNAFSNTVRSCFRIKNFTFATDNGTPYTAKWSDQDLDFTTNTGWASTDNYVINFNSGITADKEVKDDVTYQALKDDPDWWTRDVAYSRYNHDSAVATINSLPDCSAYVAEKGKQNKIRFKGSAGEKTDGGAINTLTAAEVKVANDKGWTVYVDGNVFTGVAE